MYALIILLSSGFYGSNNWVPVAVGFETESQCQIYFEEYKKDFASLKQNNGNVYHTCGIIKKGQ